jgi:hypothetical protein
MNDSRSRRIVLFLDCCYSGAFARGMAARDSGRVEIRERFEGSGRVVLTASDAMEYSFEGDDRQGQGRGSVFTSALVEGLRTGEADLDQDHLISVDELYDYVYGRVREQTPHQTPGKWSFVSGDVYVARSSYMKPAEASELPEELRAMEDSQLPYVREELVERLAVLRAQPKFWQRASETLERLREDDSRRVATAAAAALGREAPNGPPAPECEPPEPAPAPERERPKQTAAPAEPAAARAQRVWTRQQEWLVTGAAATAAAAVAGAVGGIIAWQVLWATDLKRAHVLGVAIANALIVVALSSIVAGARRTVWPLWQALLVPAVAAAVISAPLGLIDPDTRTGIILVIGLSGAIAGGAALAPSADWPSIAAAAALGGAVSALYGATVSRYIRTATPFVVHYYVVIAALLGAAVSIAIVRSPRRER